MNPVTDEALVGRIKQGDISAYEILVKRYQQRLFGFVNRIVRQPDDTADIIQSVLFRVYTRIELIDEKRKFSPYVFSMAKNEALTFMRRKHYHVPIEEEHLIEDDEKIYSQLVSQEESAAIRRVIGGLPEKYRRVIEYYYFLDLSYSEISVRCKIPLNTVRTNLRRAKELLKTQLQYETD